jgi:hypothetical protein
MSFTKESVVDAAKQDLAKRLGVGEGDISQVSVEETDFPDMSLGAAAGGEMSAQMISSGWKIKLAANGDNYEYRADKYQLRLHNFKGKNYVIKG